MEQRQYTIYELRAIYNALKGEGLTGELIKEFKISHTTLINAFSIKASGEQKTDIIEAGLKLLKLKGADKNSKLLIKLLKDVK